MIRPFNLRNCRCDVGEVVHLAEEFVSTAQLKMFGLGTLMFARVGEMACAANTFGKATISPNIIAAELNIPDLDPFFVAVFANTRYGLPQLQGAIKAVAQPTISTDIVRRFRIPALPTPFQKRIRDEHLRSLDLTGSSAASLSDAEQTLLHTLGLKDWQPPEPLTYTRRAEDVFAAGRMDADYFAPRVAGLLKRLSKSGQTVGDVAPARREKFKPGGTGEFDYVEISDVQADGTVASSRIACREAPSRATWHVRAGDVLTSTVRPIRRLSALIAPEQDGFVCSSGFVVLQPRRVAAEVLLTYLRLPLVCELMDLHTSASLYPAISDTDLLALPFPEIDKPTCVKIAADVRAAHAARHRAQALLERAKQAVEVAIEESESAALRLLADPMEGTAK